MANAQPIQQNQTAEHPILRLFKDMPGQYLIDEFLAHVRSTAEPESFAGIHPGPLDKTEPFRKLAPFSVDRRKRADGQMAYCPMCHQPNKFLEGAFVYLPRLQAVAAIGHECAAKETRDAAERDYRARRDRQIEEDYLLANLPRVPAKLAAIEQVRPAAAEALRVFRLLRKDAPTALRQLRAVKQQGARLIVAETIDDNIVAIGPAGFKGSSGKQTRDIAFGILSGTTAVINDYNPIAELDRIKQVLQLYAGHPTEDAALNVICSMTDAERQWATTRLRQTDDAFRKFQSRIADFCAFFSPENIGRIGAWTSHSEHPAPFRITRTEKSGAVIVTIRNADDRFYVAIAQVIAAHRANWPFPES